MLDLLNGRIRSIVGRPASKAFDRPIVGRAEGPVANRGQSQYFGCSDPNRHREHRPLYARLAPSPNCPAATVSRENEKRDLIYLKNRPLKHVDWTCLGTIGKNPEAGRSPRFSAARMPEAQRLKGLQRLRTDRSVYFRQFAIPATRTLRANRIFRAPGTPQRPGRSERPGRLS